MSFNHHLQRCRYELKYIIDEETARRVRDFARCHLQRDEHSIASLRHSYPIYSLYMDGPSLTLLNSVLEGHKNRYKLRVRYYDDDPHAPVFFEIKRRIGSVCVKERALVHRSTTPQLLAGHHPRREDLVNPNDVDAWWVLRRFCELRSSIHAQPRMVIYYHREAWVTPTDDNVRLTFDRRAAIARYDGHFTPARRVDAMVEGVILELKFDMRFPHWMRGLVQSCNLWRTSMSKYAHCMTQLSSRAPQLCHL